MALTRLKIALGLSLLLLVNDVTANAATQVKPGAACPYQNENRIFNGKTYTCTKVGKKWVWDKGIKNQMNTAPSTFQW